MHVCVQYRAGPLMAPEEAGQVALKVCVYVCRRGDTL